MDDRGSKHGKILTVGEPLWRFMGVRFSVLATFSFGLFFRVALVS